MADNNVEPLTQEDIKRFCTHFSNLPIIAIPSEDAKTAKALQDIARELKQIRHALERRR